MSQLGLFAEAIDASPSPSDDEPTRALAARLPRNVCFGTSSWSFPGWRGVVWPNDPAWTESRCAKEGLAVYARHPLLRTVGLDRSYYGPLFEEELAHHARRLPTDFRVVAKIWGAITSERTEEGRHHLSVDTLDVEILARLRSSFARNTGPLVLEFPPERRDVSSFAPRLARFLRAAVARAAPFTFAVELRDRKLLVPEIARALHESAVPLCFSFHPTMPSLEEQRAWADRHGVLEGDAPWVARLMLPPGTQYEHRRAQMAPFDRLVDPQEAMRRDVVALVARAVAAGRALFVTVNNKAEGSAPLTIRALAERIARG